MSSHTFDKTRGEVTCTTHTYVMLIDTSTETFFVIQMRMHAIHHFREGKEDELFF